MSRGFAGVIVACVLVCVVGVALAKDPTNSRAAATRPTQKASMKSLKGVIAHVDLEAKSIKVEVRDKQQQVNTVEITTDGKTEFLLDGTAVTLADLRDGMKVTVTPDSGVATRISAKSDPKTKSAKK